MARYYKPTKATFVDDIIYQAPHELRKQALEAQDAAFRLQQEQLEGFESDKEYVDDDEDKVLKTLRSHKDKADSLSMQMYQNPALFPNLMREVSKVKSDFERDYTTGVFEQADQTKKRREKLFKGIDDKLTAGTINEDAAAAAKAEAKGLYKGVGKGKHIEDIMIREKVDPDKYVEHLKQVVTADSTATSYAKPNGEAYIISGGEQTKYIEKKKIEDIVENDPAFQDFKEERRQTFERQLTYEDAFDKDKEKMEKALQKEIKDFKQAAINKLIFSQQTKKSDIKADSTALSLFGKNTPDIELATDGEFTLKTDYLKAGYELSNLTAYDTRGKFHDAKGQPKSEKEINRLLDNERYAMLGCFSTVGIKNSTDFLDLMSKSPAEITNVLKKAKANSGVSYTMEDLVRQANYQKARTFNRPFIQNFDETDQMSVNKQIQYIKNISNVVSQMPPTQKFDMEVYDEQGRRSHETLTMSEAETKGYVPSAMVTTEKVVNAQSGTGAYMSPSDEEYLWSEADDDAGLGTEGEAMSLEHIKKTGKALKTEVQKVQTRDPNQGLTTLKPNEVFEHTKRIYKRGGGYEDIEYFVLKKQSYKNGKLQSAMIYIPKSQVNIPNN